MKPLTRADLDKMGCQGEGCTHGPADGHALVVGARCHPGSPVWATYIGGVLEFSCGECGRPVTVIAVAP